MPPLLSVNRRVDGGGVVLRSVFLSGGIAEVADDFKIGQHVLPFHAFAHVMDDPWFAAAFGGSGNDDPDVGFGAGEFPDDDIAETVAPSRRPARVS